MTNAERVGTEQASTQMFEDHFTAKQLAKKWGYSESTVFRWFQDEPGVLRSSGQHLNPRRRTKISIRIPKSVAEKVYLERVVR